MLIYICDDEKEDRELLRKHIFTYAGEKNIEFTIYECSSGEELLASFSASKTEPTIVFLDIFMEELSGVDTASALRKDAFSGGLIFTTSSRDFAIEGFNLGADGYLCKPYEYEQFVFFFERCLHRLEGAYKTLTILSDRKEFHILLHKIDYVETCAHGCLIHAENQLLKTRTTLSEIESMLSTEACFLRCGRSYIVNMNAVATTLANDEFIYLKNGDQILIPVRERSRINSQIADFYWTKIREM